MFLIIIILTFSLSILFALHDFTRKMQNQAWQQIGYTRKARDIEKSGSNERLLATNNLLILEANEQELAKKWHTYKFLALIFAAVNFMFFGRYIGYSLPAILAVLILYWVCFDTSLNFLNKRAYTHRTLSSNNFFDKNIASLFSDKLYFHGRLVLFIASSLCYYLL